MASTLASSSSVMPTEKISTDDAAQWLAEQRRHPDRQSKKIVDYGMRVIEGCNISSKLGDDQWAFLEQVGLAALDVGNADLAGLCVSRLSTRFPGSARVAALRGMLFEVNGEYEKAFDLYDTMLATDESNLPIVKRMVAVLKCMDQKDGMSGTAAAIKSLTKYLDTYYSDPEGWQELAALYLEQSMYAQAAFALEELIVLVPHNSFYVLQYAEVLATSGELGSAYKQYLRVLEMCEAQDDDATTNTRQGPLVRALWGLKTVTGKLLAASTTVNGKAKSNAVSTTAAKTADEKPEKINAIDALVTDLLLNKAYTGNSAGVRSTRQAARQVLQQSS